MKFLSRYLPLLIASFLLSACSPASLFGNGKDAGIQSLPTYHRPNMGCSQLDLSHSRMDLNSARGLMTCLNGGGAMGDVAKLVKSMSDEELAPFVESLNRSLLNQPRTLFELERSFQDLEERGELPKTLSSIGELLKNEELITRTFHLFKKSFAPTGEIKPDFLRALEQLSTQLTEEKIQDGMDLALTLADAQAFSSLWERLTGTAGRVLSPGVGQGIAHYLSSPSQLGRELIERWIDGGIDQVSDKIVPLDEAGIRSKAPEWASLVNISLAQSGQVLGDLNAMFSALRKPIPCFQNARAMRDLPMDLFRELSSVPSSGARSFFERDKLMQLELIVPLCALPIEVPPGYAALQRLAASPGIESFADIIHAIYQVGHDHERPMAEFVIRALGDDSLRNLVPAMAELQARGAVQDALLLATKPLLKDRAQFTDFLKLLIAPLPGIENESIYSVTASAAAQLSAEDITAILQGFHQTDSGLASVIRSLRLSYYVNDVHPGIELLRNSLAQASSDPKLLQAILRVSSHPEFRAAIHELNQMAATKDGRLKDLIQTTLNLFHRYAARAQIPVHTLARGAFGPEIRIQSRHHLSSSDLVSLELTDRSDLFASCREVDLAVHWDDSAGPRFESQLGAIAACANGDHQYEELSASLLLLTRMKSDRTENSSPLRSLHAIVVDAYRSLSFTHQEVALLADWTLTAVNDGRILRALKIIPIWVNHSVIRPLVNLANPISTSIQARGGLQRLGIYAAMVLKRDDFQKILAYVDDLFNSTPAPQAAAPVKDYDQARILRWIGNKECSELPNTSEERNPILKSRLHEVIDEYENAVVAHGPLVSGKLAQHWSLTELRGELEPIFQKFGKIKENGDLLHALLHFTARLNDPQQYPRGYLQKWLRKRAEDRRMISYLYPGETRPRVRLVNGLDRLSIILQNADIYAPDPISTNFGMQFLADISEAWGDVPFESRPPEIQAKFPKGGRTPCPTLAQAVSAIKESAQAFDELVRFPNLPTCQQVADPRDPEALQKQETTDPNLPPLPSDTPPADAATPEVIALQASLFNIAQTIDVLQENVDDGGLRILRDLFFDLYYTGPARNRDSNAGLNNNLSVVMRLVKVGVLHEAGQRILETKNSGPDAGLLENFFQTLIEGAASAELEPLVKRLFIEEADRELVWKTLEEVLQLQDPIDIARAKSIAFRGFAAIDQLGKARDPSHNELLDPALRALLPILSQYRSFLILHANLAGDLLKSSDINSFLHALTDFPHPAQSDLTSLALDAMTEKQRGLDLMAILSALDSSTSAHQDWENFRSRWNEVKQLPEFRALGLSELGRQGLDLLEGRTRKGDRLLGHDAELSRKLLISLATLLERDQMELVDQLLSLAKRDPEGLNQLVSAMSRLIENGEIPHLLDLLPIYLGPAA